MPGLTLGTSPPSSGAWTRDVASQGHSFSSWVLTTAWPSWPGVSLGLRWPGVALGEEGIAWVKVWAQ